MVQMTATNLVMTFKQLSYKDRHTRLQLPTLQYRCTKGDMNAVFKIITNKYDNNVNHRLE